MKQILLFIGLIACGTQLSFVKDTKAVTEVVGEEYNAGWNAGYKAGWCYGQGYGCYPPYPPYPPYPRYGEDNFEGGYQRGFLQALADRG